MRPLPGARLVAGVKMSLVITTYNRGALLRNSLNRLLQLTLPDEVVVVDDGGDDETRAVCALFDGHVELHYIYNHNPAPSICSLARNIGVRQAKNDWIVTAEPELMYRTDILAQFARLQSDYPNDVISAGTVHFASAGWEGSGDEPPPGVQTAVGWVAPYTALWYRPWLVDVGGWDESFPGAWGWDDTDVLTRLRINGHGQHIALECEAIHQHHGLGRDPDSVNEQHFNAKSFHGDEGRVDDLVANKDRQWGTIIRRS